MRSEELFDEELDVAQSAGYQPDAELMSKLTDQEKLLKLYLAGLLCGISVEEC